LAVRCTIAEQYGATFLSSAVADCCEHTDTDEEDASEWKTTVVGWDLREDIGWIY
jgi:hypothetical protein